MKRATLALAGGEIFEGTAVGAEGETVGEVVVPQGVLRYSAKDHYGYDARARFVLTAKDGTWRATP